MISRRTFFTTLAALAGAPGVLRNEALAAPATFQHGGMILGRHPVPLQGLPGSEPITRCPVHGDGGRCRRGRGHTGAHDCPPGTAWWDGSARGEVVG